MVKPASDTVGFLTRQCQPHLLTGLLLTNELQDFVKKNTRSNTISSMNEWINVLVWVEFVGIYIIFYELYSVILLLRLINVISVGNGWIWRGRQDRLWWWWQRIQGEGQRQGGQSCCSLQRLRLSCSCSSPLRSRVLLLVSSILQTGSTQTNTVK